LNPRLAWAAVDPATGALLEEHEGDWELPAASTIKIFIASALLRSGADLDEPVEVAELPLVKDSFVAALSPAARLTLGDLLTLMLAVSDNTATNAILDRIGLGAVNMEIERLGLTRTSVRRRMGAPGQENITCARDLARGLAALAGVWRIVDALALSQHSDLRHLLGPAVRIASKSGELPGVRHEVALCEANAKRLAIAVCSSPPAPWNALAERGFELWRNHVGAIPGTG
jgi:beta-lactamase class A